MSYTLLLQVALFILSILGTASVGYFLNDLCDIEPDRIAQKSNSAAALSTIQRIALLISLCLVALLPWLMLPNKGFPWLLGLLGCLIIYSVPPFRFKERALAGALCDMSYGHILPIFITLQTFGTKLPNDMLLTSILLAVLSLKGFRNICRHQLDDRRADRKAQQNTFVLAMKPLFIHRLLNSVVLPLELVLLFILLYLAPFANGVWWTSYLGFLAYKSLLFASWYLYKKRWAHTQFEILHAINDFYEYWLPFIIALSFSLAHNHYAILVIIIYSLLFPKFFGKIHQELGYIRAWLNTPY